MDAMVEALMPFVMFAAVLWGIEAIVTMLIRDHKKAKRKQAREKRRLEYQDRRMANDAEHAKVTRAMRYDVLRRDDFHCLHAGGLVAECGYCGCLVDEHWDFCARCGTHFMDRRYVDELRDLDV